MSAATLISDWKNNNGKVFEFSQPEGFCISMCHYWVSLRLKGEGGAEIMARFLGTNMQRRCHDRQVQTGGTSYSVPGASKHKEGKKSSDSGR